MAAAAAPSSAHPAPGHRPRAASPRRLRLTGPWAPRICPESPAGDIGSSLQRRNSGERTESIPKSAGGKEDLHLLHGESLVRFPLLLIIKAIFPKTGCWARGGNINRCILWKLAVHFCGALALHWKCRDPRGMGTRDHSSRRKNLTKVSQPRASLDFSTFFLLRSRGHKVEIERWRKPLNKAGSSSLLEESLKQHYRHRCFLLKMCSIS